jgi:hypothetical protein
MCIRDRGSTYPLERAVERFGDKIPLCAGIDHLGPLFTWNTRGC